MHGYALRLPVTVGTANVPPLHPDAMASAVCSGTSRAPVAAAQQARARRERTLSASWRPAALPAQPQARRPGAAHRQRRAAAVTRALFGGLGAVFRNDPAERTRKQYQDKVDQVNALEADMERLSDGQLRQLTQALRGRAAAGEPLDQLLVESFAVSGASREVMPAGR